MAARNILVNINRGTRVFKISDFGLARAYPGVQSSNEALPLRWMAPESILFGLFSFKTDVWSFGVLVWEMFNFNKYYPYANIPTNDELRLNLITCLYSNRQTLTIPSQCS